MKGSNIQRGKRGREIAGGIEGIERVQTGGGETERRNRGRKRGETESRDRVRVREER